MIKEIKKIITFNMKTLITFEGIYKLSSIFIFVPLFWKLFDFIMKVRGYRYLTIENIGSFLFNPLTILMLLILVLLIVVYSIFDIHTVLVIFDASKNNQKISIREALALAIPKSLKVFHFKNFSFTFIVTFFIFFLNLGLTTSFLSSFSIPEFILNYIHSKLYIQVFFILFLFVMLFFVLRNLYTYHYYLLDESSLKISKQKSQNLSKNTIVKDFLTLTFTELVLFISYVVFISIGIFIIYFIHSFFENVLIESILITITGLFILIVFSFYYLISMPLCLAVISSLFYQHKEEKNEKVHHFKLSSKKSKIPLKKWKIFKISLIVFILFSGSLFTHEALEGKYDFALYEEKPILVTAHRGASKDFKENTMEAFLEAKRLEADWIELDLRCTKDKQVVVLHDASLKRTYGINKKISEVDYEEVSSIPLFKDVLLWAKANHVKLNVEFKASGDFDFLVYEVLRELKKEDYFFNVVLASSNYEVLKMIKAYDEHIKTVYVTSLLYGDLESLNEADIFSVSEANVTKNLISQIHEQGKELYVWTVNTSETIQKMKELGVDNVITDDVALAKKMLDVPKKKNVLTDYIKLIESLIN